MEIDSLGFKTDLFFARFSGEVVDRGDYLAIRTPTNPAYHWGNFLIFPHPPRVGDEAAWSELFTREIASRQPTSHVALGWSGDELGNVQPFLDRGFEVDQSIVQVAREVHPPPRGNVDVHVRSLRSDSDWAQALENQVACGDTDKYGLKNYIEYKTPKMRDYRAMQEEGLGEWFGAFLGDKLVADLGIFFEENVARYQTVGTHPNYRRRGICGSLVYQTALHTLEKYGVDTLVMLADPDYHAARIYESVGFQPEEMQYGVQWWSGADPEKTDG